jgi:transmembrane sensor
MVGSKIAFLFLLSAVACSACNDNPGPAKIAGSNGDTIYRSGATLRTPLTLPDGTQILMDSFSVVRLGAGFNKLNRELFLEGKGLFTVHSAGTKPFIIHTRALVTTVLDADTAIFKVDGYAKSPGEEVDLFAGSLKVIKSYHSDTDNEPVILHSGEMVMINTDIDLMEKEKLDSAELRTRMGTADE